MKLNFGSGQYLLEGYKNVDADPTTPADVHANALTYLDRMADNQIAEVYAGHFLEHLDKPEADRFLRHCYRVLAPGGVCAIVVPDIREVLKRYIGGTLEAIPMDDRLWHLNDLDDVCGWFLYSTIQTSRHLWAYDEFTLRRAMRQAGFVDLTRIDRYADPRLGAGCFWQCGFEGHKP